MSDLLLHTTAEVVADYDLLREGCARIPVDHLSAVILSGEDRKGWLQGQATANLRSFTDGVSATFAFCEVTGHAAALVEAWHQGDRVLMTVHPAAKPAVLARVRDFVVVEDVVAEDADAAYALVSVQGPRATADLADVTELPSLDAGMSEIAGVPVALCRSNRTGMGGWDVWIPRGAGDKAIAELEKAFPLAHAEAAEAARIEAGVPLWTRDANTRTLPPELGPHYESKAVSYNKGCYMGQEVLHRIHARGHVNRQWMGLVSESAIPVGAKIMHRHRPEAGVVTSAAFSPDYGYVAAGMIRHEVAEHGEAVQVETPDGLIDAELRRMPILRFD